MKQELENQLSKDFPFMVAKSVWDDEVCLDDDGNEYGFPCECGDGWYQLLHNLCQEITDYYNEKGADTSKIHILQIKEKFGELRFYHNGLIEGSEDIIDKYTDISLQTCMSCGNKGKLRNYGGWLTTLCDSCEEERKKNYK